MDLTGTCVDTQVDFNNCGSIGAACPLNYSSCEAGVCSANVTIRLSGGVPVAAWIGNDQDDEEATINLSVNITLYNYVTDTVIVTSNGVSEFTVESHCSRSTSLFSLSRRSFRL
jgi:hypothetical protein